MHNVKKVIALLLLVFTMIGVVAGCGSNQRIRTQKELREDKAKISNWADQQSDDDRRSNQSGESLQQGEDGVFTTIAPKIVGLASEKKPLAKLERLIIDYYEIPKQYWSETMYFYNYVDLNEDGKREIFVVIMGSYTSGTGGSSALWLKDTQEITSACVLQAFTLMQLPIVVSNNTSSGYKDLVVPYYDHAANEYRVLCNQNGKYDSVERGRLIMSLDDISGEAIMVDGNVSANYGTKLELGKGL